MKTNPRAVWVIGKNLSSQPLKSSPCTSRVCPGSLSCNLKKCSPQNNQRNQTTPRQRSSLPLSEQSTFGVKRHSLR